MSSIFQKDISKFEKELKKTKRIGKLYSLFTLGIYNNNFNIQKAHDNYIKSKKQYEKFISLQNHSKILNDQLIQTVVLDGIRVSKNTFADFPVLGSENYPDNWEALRKLILVRDNYQCQEESAECKGPLQIHHIIPLSKGGSNDKNNLITLCMYHHSLKHEHMRIRYADLWI